jgi:UDP-N-acetylglucosamine 2-epimerase (non-hydrolysing)
VGGLAAVHFAPTATARDNLLSENVPADRIYVTGNTSVDALLIASAATPRRLAVPETWLKGKRLVLVTAHRRESWGAGIRDICLALRQLAEQFPDVVVVYAVHPNPIVRDTVHEILPFGGVYPERSRRAQGRSGCDRVHLASPASLGEPELASGQPGGRGGGKSWWERVHLIEPPDYAGFVGLMKRSYVILTDSGGIQEEAPSLGKPVLVMRRTTERVEGVQAGCSELVGTDRTRIVERTTRLLTDRRAYRGMVRRANPYGDGKAASRIRRALAYHFGLARRRPPDFRGTAD